MFCFVLGLFEGESHRTPISAKNPWPRPHSTLSSMTYCSISCCKFHTATKSPMAFPRMNSAAKVVKSFHLRFVQKGPTPHTKSDQNSPAPFLMLYQSQERKRGSILRTRNLYRRCSIFSDRLFRSSGILRC